MTIATSSRYLSVNELAKQLAVDERQILRWIKGGELHAINVVGRVGKRPRWRISTTDLQLFIDRRSASPTPATTRRRRKDSSVVEFF